MKAEVGNACPIPCFTKLPHQEADLQRIAQRSLEHWTL
jgi:hypothetical protein